MRRTRLRRGVAPLLAVGMLPTLFVPSGERCSFTSYAQGRGTSPALHIAYFGN